MVLGDSWVGGLDWITSSSCGAVTHISQRPTPVESANTGV